MPYSAISPRRAKDVVNLAPAAANRTSHISAWVRPMPAQAPLIAAMTGLRRVVRKNACRSPTIAERSASPALSTVADPMLFRSPMSAPAQKARPLPVMTIARTAGSASARSRPA